MGLNDFFKIVPLKVETNQILNIIYNFVILNEYDNFTTQFEMLKNIQEKEPLKIDLSKEEFLKGLRKLNFYDVSIYKNEENADIDELKNTLYNVQIFFIKLLSGEFEEKEEILKKEIVYDYSKPFVKMSINKMDIKPTGRGYGLLFR